LHNAIFDLLAVALCLDRRMLNRNYCNSIFAAVLNPAQMTQPLAMRGPICGGTVPLGSIAD
jgi:hypothetical protein